MSSLTCGCVWHPARLCGKVTLADRQSLNVASRDDSMIMNACTCDVEVSTVHSQPVGWHWKPAELYRRYQRPERLVALQARSETRENPYGEIPSSRF